jgi:16S rRNA (guanine966-N2)-methyltransferase
MVTRPITDRVKEMLFERLTNDLPEARVADVFAGTGTLGLEALSRGAKSVVFVESDHRAHELLEANVAKLGVESETLCWKADVMRCSYRPKGVPGFLPFDVIFFDPPYRLVPYIKPGDSLYKSLERLAKDEVSSPDALMVFRTPEESQFTLPPAWNIESTLDVSRMSLHFAQKKTGNS